MADTWKKSFFMAQNRNLHLKLLHGYQESILMFLKILNLKILQKWRHLYVRAV